MADRRETRDERRLRLTEAMVNQDEESENKRNKIIDYSREIEAANAPRAEQILEDAFLNLDDDTLKTKEGRRALIILRNAALNTKNKHQFIFDVSLGTDRDEYNAPLEVPNLPNTSPRQPMQGRGITPRPSQPQATQPLGITPPVNRQETQPETNTVPRGAQGMGLNRSQPALPDNFTGPVKRSPFNEYVPRGDPSNEPADTGIADFNMRQMPTKLRGATGSSAIGWDPQQRGNIFDGLAPGRNGGGIGSMGGGQYVPTVGIVPNNPRNAQFAPQFRESAFNSRQMDLNSQMRKDAFMVGINQKRRLRGEGQYDQGIIDNAVAANQQQVGRNFMSARDKAMISRPMGGQQEQRSGYGDTNPINGRGIEGFIPSGNMPDLRGYRQYDNGARYQGSPNRNGISPDILVGRTATGGVSLVGEADLNSPGGITDQSRAAASQRRDARIIGNQIKYGLSPETPAVAAATERSTMRNAPARAERKGIERMNKQRQDLEDLQQETTLEHFRSIKDPLARRTAIEKHLGGQGLPASKSTFSKVVGKLPLRVRSSFPYVEPNL